MSEDERHASNLELFLDLVFVFAVTQIASLVDHDLTISGVARGVLVAWLVWWQWSQFTWAGSAVNLQQRVATRILVLCTIPATLTMAVSIPHSFGTDGHDTGKWFGVAYLVVQLLVLGMQGTTAMRDASTRKAFIDFVSFASIAPVLVAAGGFAHDGVRVGFWVAAALINVVAALRGASGQWVINPVHFAERHTLFVIISLGEAVISIGATASQIGLDRATFVGLVAGSAVACVLWWVYFAFTPAVTEHTLRHAATVRRGTVARDLFTFGHFPIVAGILGYAVAVKHMVHDPRAPLPLDDRWLLIAAMAVFIGGCLNIQWHVVHRLAPERFVAIAVISAWLLIGDSLAGWTAVGGIALVLAAMQAITWRRFRAGALAEIAEVR